MSNNGAKRENGTAEAPAVSVQRIVMPLFFKPTIKSVTYRRELVTNDPVNLSMCQRVSKGRFAWYPDNIGKPSIKFHGCDTEWVYDQEGDRDADFNRIVGNEWA